jgi:hypothetical protein
VIAGLTGGMLAIKMVKTLPGLPFAPGHKNVIMLPMYVLAREASGARFGATSCGACMGLLSFLMGDGRYGIFEVAKHIVPGLLVDLLYPPIQRIFGVRVWSMTALGVVLATGRLATEVGIAFMLGAPAAFFAYIGIAGVTHLGAGALSGPISAALVGTWSAMHYRAEQAPLEE